MLYAKTNTVQYIVPEDKGLIYFKEQRKEERFQIGNTYPFGKFPELQ